MSDSIYCGRFAPSPTGNLHLGSLLTAVASFLDARSRRGQWLVRMEDLDPPREVGGAADSILRTLERLGLHWDSEVLYQSRRLEAYHHTLEELRKLGLVYACGCTRREIRDSAREGASGPVYAGTCRAGLPAGRKPRSVRIRVKDVSIHFDDRLQGPSEECLPTEVGDFILQRADGLFAYQLAVVVDDALQGVSDIVRGTDLLGSTGRQIYLQQVLGLPTPAYLHLPVVVNVRGEKLSKQTGAPAIDPRAPLPVLTEVLEMLGQQVPAAIGDATLEEFWQWAADVWEPDRIPRSRAIEHR
ncbi:MAG: tRNA glutamyl-Q(34) synthetase GluQRS [Gammaproteobacteria bacterium]|jgi:glutamyl-Q tRNA(Asp) synthetase